MALLYMCAPEDLDVREKFCLRNEVCGNGVRCGGGRVRGTGEPLVTRYSLQPGVAYGSVISELVKLTSLTCPSDKLTTLGVFPGLPAHMHWSTAVGQTECLSPCAVHASKSVFQCIEDYYSKFEERPCPKQSGM